MLCYDARKVSSRLRPSLRHAVPVRLPVLRQTYASDARLEDLGRLIEDDYAVLRDKYRNSHIYLPLSPLSCAHCLNGSMCF